MPTVTKSVILRVILDAVFVFFQEDIDALFRKADVDHSGTLTVKEFKDVMEDIRERYPQIELYMQRQHFKSMMDFIRTAIEADKQHEVEISLEQFKEAFGKVDSQMKQLPATAQVCFKITACPSCQNERQSLGRIKSY